MILIQMCQPVSLTDFVWSTKLLDFFVLYFLFIQKEQMNQNAETHLKKIIKTAKTDAYSQINS